MRCPLALPCLALFCFVAVCLPACEEAEQAQPLTPLQRLRRAQAAAPPLPPPPPPAPVVAAPPIKVGESILQGDCPLIGEDPRSCPSKLKKPAGEVTAAHVLIGWRGTLPGRGPDRDETAARALAVEVAHKARKVGANFIALVHRYSDDTGAGVYTFNRATRRRYVKPFARAAAAIEVGQIVAVRSRFGYHVIRRMKAGFVAPPRPLEAIVQGECPRADEDPASCPPEPSKTDAAAAKTPARVVVEHILIGYKGSLTRRRGSRTEAEARSLAIDVTHKAREKGADFARLRALHSDDPGDGRYAVTPGSVLEPAFMRRALSLSVGNVAVVHSSFGYHVMRRME